MRSVKCELYVGPSLLRDSGMKGIYRLLRRACQDEAAIGGGFSIGLNRRHTAMGPIVKFVNESEVYPMTDRKEV